VTGGTSEIHRRLLLADKSPTIRRVIELTFSGEAISVVSVGSGEAAMEAVAATIPDIVLADAAMASPDGYELASFIKQTPELAHIPVVLLTAAFQPVDERRSRAAGCDAVLAKPFELTELVWTVKELLASRETAPEAAAGPAAGDAPVDGTSDVTLEDLFDAVDTELSRSPEAPATRGEARRAVVIRPGEGWWRGTDRNALSLDDYFDRVDEESRRPRQVGTPSLRVSADSGERRRRAGGSRHRPGRRGNRGTQARIPRAARGGDS
jgi:CheY-like chemotaxis protein